MGVGVFARLQYNTRQEIRQWDPRAENRVPICASNMGPESETGSRCSSDRITVHRDLLGGILGGIQRVGALCFL
jgi:hypothetical protein